MTAGGNTLFEEKAYLVARVEEVVVADMISAVLAARGKLCHGMVVEREVLQPLFGISQQFLDRLRRERVWHKEVSILFEKSELVRREALDGWWHCSVMMPRYLKSSAQNLLLYTT